jgi:predicted TIM-barrel fold metal-dependent hydrolase
MMLRSVQQHLGPRDGGSSRCRAVHASSTGEAAVLDVFDPHFHLFDPVAVHNGDRSDGSSFVAYHQPDYEQDMGARMPAGFRHVGGCWVEAMSVCFTSLDAPALQQHCVSEAAFVETELKRSSLEYVLCASACLEDPSVSETLQQLVKSHPGMRAIRQIANVSPDWPRNGRLGNLVRQAQWRAGYEQLARFGLGFDLQCNPWQLESYVEEVVAPNPAVPCVLNHLGLPLLAELSTPDLAAVYWKGMDALARCPHGAQFPTSCWSALAA